MDRVDILKALSNPTRLYIMEMLLQKEKERCVCELVEELPFAQSTISKHLTILRNTGLVTNRKEGLKIFYKPAHGEIKYLLQSLENLEERIIKEPVPGD